MSEPQHVAALPAHGRLHSSGRPCFLLRLAAGKPFEDWTNKEVVDWAEAKNYHEVVTILEQKQLRRRVLAGWGKANFEKYLGGAYGASFYGHLLGTPALRARLVVGSRGYFSPNRRRADSEPPSTLCGRCWYIAFLCIF